MISGEKAETISDTESPKTTRKETVVKSKGTSEITTPKVGTGRDCFFSCNQEQGKVILKNNSN